MNKWILFDSASSRDLIGEKDSVYKEWLKGMIKTISLSNFRINLESSLFDITSLFKENLIVKNNFWSS